MCRSLENHIFQLCTNQGVEVSTWDGIVDGLKCQRCVCFHTRKIARGRSRISISENIKSNLAFICSANGRIALGVRRRDYQVQDCGRRNRLSHLFRCTVLSRPSVHDYVPSPRGPNIFHLQIKRMTFIRFDARCER